MKIIKIVNNKFSIATDIPFGFRYINDIGGAPLNNSKRQGRSTQKEFNVMAGNTRYNTINNMSKYPRFTAMQNESDYNWSFTDTSEWGQAPERMYL